MWHKIVPRVGGCTVTELKKRMTATEYIRWCLVLADEKNERTPEMWYHAQTTSALHCVPFWVWGKSPPEGLDKPETFLLTFVDGSDKPEEREKSEAELKEEATMKSKSSGWGVLLKMPGFAPDENRPKPKLPDGVVNIASEQMTSTPEVKTAFPQVERKRKGPKRPAVERHPRQS